MTSHEQPTRAKSVWIVGPWFDLAFFVATPVVILPIVFGARSCWSDVAIVLFISAFGQLGHTLPGMMRAYGDRALFQRFKTRFIVAPILLVIGCVVGFCWHLHGLILVSAIWAIWHALMQTYGFVRIYEAKRAAPDVYSKRLDFAMCFLWFGGAVLLPDRATSMLLEHYYASGGPTISAGFLATVRMGWMFSMIVVTVGFLGNCVWRMTCGDGLNPIKIVLMAISFGFYWFAYAIAGSLLIGAAMFEIFHDVQYLSIVWLFNRNRVEKGKNPGGFLRMLFGRSTALVGIYIGIVFAFGGLRYIEFGLSQGRLQELLTGFLAAVGLLHYYYDGFIWKIRESQTQDSLGLDSSKGRSVINVPGMAHTLKWSAFVLPIGWLMACQILWPANEQSIRESIVETLPNHVEDRLRLGKTYRGIGQDAEAIKQFQAVLLKDSYHAVANISLADLLIHQGSFSRAEEHLRRALRCEPNQTNAHNLLGITYARQSKWKEAEWEFRVVVRLAPNYADGHFNLGNVLQKRGKHKQASACFLRALQIRPTYAKARAALNTSTGT